MESFDKDWVTVRTGAADLQDYLLSNTLYWPVTQLPEVKIPEDQPRFTIGNLLLSLQRLEAAPLSDSEQKVLAELKTRIMQTRDHWRSHWSEKAKEELASRLPRLQKFISGLGGSNPPSRAEYAYEIRNRVILHLLMNEIDQATSIEYTALTNLDSMIQSHLRTGDFVWDEQLQAAFPRNPFWYLYVSPAKA